MQFAEVEYLSCEGGGLKGIGHVGGFKSLMDNGLWNGVKAISGSSAGAIAALIGCTGWDYEKMLKLFLSIDFERLLTTDSGKLATLGGDSIPMLGKILETVTDPVNITSNIIKRFGIHKHKNLLIAIEKVVKEVSGLDNCTFEEWHTIRETNLQLKRDSKNLPVSMKKYSEKMCKIKDVWCEAGCLNTGYNTVFSWNNPLTKKVPISRAITASCAFPYYITPVLIDDRYYVDGGAQRNCPGDVFEEKPGVPHPRLICMMLEDTEGIKKYLTGTTPVDFEITSLVSYSQAVMKLVKRTQEYNFLKSGYIEQSIFINTLGLTTFDYVLFAELKDKIIDSGIKAMDEHLYLRFGIEKK